jgi:hypothetical protein
MRIARLESRTTRVRSTAISLGVLLTAALLVFAQPARADIGEKIILRCTHNESLSGFSQSDYHKALKELEADAEEYSGCSLRITEAEAAAAGTRGSASSAGGGAVTPPAVAIAATPAEQRAITRAVRSGAGPVKLGGQVIHPGVVRVDVASALSSLPTPLLATLALLLVCLLLLAGNSMRKRVRGERTD